MDIKLHSRPSAARGGCQIFIRSWVAISDERSKLDCEQVVCRLRFVYVNVAIVVQSWAAERELQARTLSGGRSALDNYPSRQFQMAAPLVGFSLTNSQLRGADELNSASSGMTCLPCSVEDGCEQSSNV